MCFASRHLTRHFLVNAAQIGSHQTLPHPLRRTSPWGEVSPDQNVADPMLELLSNCRSSKAVPNGILLDLPLPCSIKRVLVPSPQYMSHSTVDLALRLYSTSKVVNSKKRQSTSRSFESSSIQPTAITPAFFLESDPTLLQTTQTLLLPTRFKLWR